VAGLAMDRARQHESPADVRAMLRAYGIDQRQSCKRLLWLEDRAELQRWHRGEASSCLAHDLEHKNDGKNL